MSSPADSTVQNILPVQAYFNIDGSFNTFIGQGKPFIVSATESIGIIDTSVAGTFYPTFSPVSSGQVTSLSVTSLKLSFNPDTGVFSSPFFSGFLNGTANTANNLANGIASQIPYQTGNGSTAFIPNGSIGQVLTSNGTSAPSWQNGTGGVSVTDDTTTNATRYPLFASQTSGSLTTEYTSSTKYQYNPSTGLLTATGFSGSGANLTNIPNSALTNSSFTLGSTSISLGSTTTTVAGLTSVTSTTFVGALTGNASSATTATTATTATNATNTAITDNTSSSSTWYPTIVSSTTGNLPQTTSSTKLSFVPSTGTLTATNFAGLASSATNVVGGAANQVLYQTGSGATSFITAPTTASTYLSWTGSAFAWATASGGGGSPGGSTTQLQYNNAGSFGGVPLLTYNGTTLAMTGSTIDSTVIGGSTPAAGTFTALTGQTEVLKGTGQNLITQSQTLATSPWTTTTITAANNSTVAPDGSSTATSLIPTTSSAIHQISQSITTSASLTLTASFYAKANGYTAISAFNSPNNFIHFDLSGVAVSTLGTGWTNATITSVGNGWYRCTLTASSANWAYFTITVDNAFVASGNSAPAPYAGNGTSGAYIWGVQLELGSTANNYIPTTTTAVYGTPTLSFSGVAGLGLQSDGSLYVSPAGTGALQAQATTSSTVGGNARGANAVDWQTLRGAATQVASGAQSVVGGGTNNYANALICGVLSGGFNGASSQYSVIAGGAANNASQYAAGILAGQGNAASGYMSIVGGGYVNATNSASAVTTQAAATNGVTSGSTAVTLAASNAAIKVGQLIQGTGILIPTYVAAISGTSLTLSQNANATGTPTLSFYTPHGVVVGGGNNQATGSYSFIGGGGDAGTAANRNVASGDWSFVGGGIKNTNAGSWSFIGAGGSNTSGSFFSGNSITSFATNSAIVSGTGNSAQAHYSFIGAGGNNIVNANYTAIAGGQYGTTRSIVGNAVFPACSSPIAGSAGVSQSALLVLGRQTTDATATVLTSDVNAAGGTNQVILPNNSAYYFKASIISGVTGGGNSKAWTIEGLIKRGANAASAALVGTPVVNIIAADAGASTWAISATADTTNGGLAITFTGQASTTIRTVCKVETTEMTY